MTITSAPAGRPTARRATGTAAIFLLVLPGLAWAVLRLVGGERGYLVQLMAFTPYAALWAWVPVVVALARRRLLAAAFAVVAAAALGVAVAPRALPDADPGPGAGAHVTVMTVNLFVGGADPQAIVRLVRDRNVAVLAVQEFTPGARRGLAAAGVDALLPHQALAEELGTTGSGLYSRYPMTAQGSRRGRGGNLQAYATIVPPGAAPVAVESAHPLAPFATSALPAWRADLAAEPVPAPDGPPRVLLGDFNSTLDHAPVRELIARGYRDAADAVGEGLSGTWPYDGRPIPKVVIDHVLVDRRIGVRQVSVWAIPRSDHRAVLATVQVPAAEPGGR
jgi:endonuclease/exonuclease/phosphatase family metal-dependent hydrolase